jgi:hypothetical protein
MRKGKNFLHASWTPVLRDEIALVSQTFEASLHPTATTAARLRGGIRSVRDRRPAGGVIHTADRAAGEG